MDQPQSPAPRPSGGRELPSTGKLLTTNDVGRYVGVSERTVANWIDRGYLPAFRTPGGHRRVDPKALSGFLMQRGMPVPDQLDAPPARILVVEDDVAVGETLKSYLSDPTDGFDVHLIHDGVSALLDIGQRPPRAVLLDVVMPEMSGIEVCKKIRSNPGLSDTQVVFVTGLVDLDANRLLPDTGAAGLLFKPVRRADLLNMVRVVLGRAPLAIPRSGT